MDKHTFLFISHATKDKEIIESFVELLYRIGMSEENMFCSLISEIGVPIKEDIYGYLRDLIDSDTVIPVFMLSENYYDSVACLNEMGAVWLKQKDYFTFILPGFSLKDIKGAVNPSKRAIKFDNEVRELKADLASFKNYLCQIFDLLPISEQRWERYRDDFIDSVKKFSSNQKHTYGFDISESQGYCIGHENYGACNVTVNKVVGKITTEFDFSKTPADLCSLAIFTEGINIQNAYRSGKKLCFYLRASEEVNILSVELHFSSRSIAKQLQVEPGWEYYSIPLANFSAYEKLFECLKEICFVVNRNNTVCGTFEVKDIEII